MWCLVRFGVHGLKFIDLWQLGRLNKSWTANQVPRLLRGVLD